MGEPILNLSSWIDRRRKEVGPYADHIVHSVKAYEARITALEAENARLKYALEWAYSGDGLDECALVIDRMLSPFKVPKSPCHATQVGIRQVLDAICARAALEGE